MSVLCFIFLKKTTICQLWQKSFIALVPCRDAKLLGVAILTKEVALEASEAIEDVKFAVAPLALHAAAVKRPHRGHHLFSLVHASATLGTSVECIVINQLRQ